MPIYEIIHNSDLTSGRGKTVYTDILFLHEYCAIDFVCSSRYTPMAVQGVVPGTVEGALYCYRKRPTSAHIYSSLKEYDEAQTPDLSGTTQVIDGVEYVLVKK